MAGEMESMMVAAEAGQATFGFHSSIPLVWRLPEAVVVVAKATGEMVGAYLVAQEAPLVRELLPQAAGKLQVDLVEPTMRARAIPMQSLLRMAPLEKEETG